MGMLQENWSTNQKWINLMLIMIDDYIGEGHYVTMDSAYMGDIMAQIGREVWKMNMVGMVQTNRLGAEMAETVKR